MFSDCRKLTSLEVSNFDTRNVTNMSGMFYYCNELTSLDVSNFDTRNVTGMRSMFNNCEGLINLDVSNFDTRNVTNMSWMFFNCSKLIDLDVSNFDTRNVTNMSWMFYNCSKLTDLDVSNFDTRNVTDASVMLYGMDNLKKIILGENISKNILSSLSRNWCKLPEYIYYECLYDSYDSITSIAGTYVKLQNLSVKWLDKTKDKRPYYVTVKIYDANSNSESMDSSGESGSSSGAEASNEKLVETVKISEDESGIWLASSKFDLRNYTVKVDPIEGYQTDITTDPSTGIVTITNKVPDDADYTITFKYKTTVIAGKVSFIAKNYDINTLKSTIELYSNNQSTGKQTQATANNDGVYSFTIKQEENVKYSVQSVKVEQNDKDVSPAFQPIIAGTNITYNEISKIFKFTKIWQVDKANNYRATFKLIKTVNGVKSDVIYNNEIVTKTVIGNNLAVFSDLPKYENGYEIEYGVEEIKIEKTTDGGNTWVEQDLKQFKFQKDE